MRKLENGDTIYPQWEDKNNIRGGCWSFKIPKDKCRNVYFNLMKYILGECLIHEDIEYSIINGISISPKKNFSIVKIWLKYNAKKRPLQNFQKTMYIILDIKVPWLTRAIFFSDLLLIQFLNFKTR